MIDNAISQIDLVSPSLLDNVDYIENSLLVFDDISELNFSNHPIRVNGVVFALCIEGYSEVSVNLKEHKLTTNSLMLTFPEQIIQNFGKSESYSGLYIIISPHFIDRTLKSVKELLPFILYAKDNPCLTLTAEEVSTFKEYHSLLKSKIRMSDNKFRSEIVKGILISLFYDIYSIIDKKSAIHNNVSKTRKEEIYQSFMKELADNYKQERSVAFYANRLCLTSKHLSGVVKEVTGKTAGEIIDEIVILEARALLKSTDYNIQEISELLNFSNQSFFGKYFKHFVGMSPKLYRKL